MKRPAYATIAALGNLFSLVYFREQKPGGASSGYVQGYDEGVFREARGSGIPLVDYRTMDFNGYEFPTVAETCSHCFGGEWPLQRWLDEVRRRGATVTAL
jgi:hypothetical protein